MYCHTLSLHDALPIFAKQRVVRNHGLDGDDRGADNAAAIDALVILACVAGDTDCDRRRSVRPVGETRGTVVGDLTGAGNVAGLVQNVVRDGATAIIDEGVAAGVGRAVPNGPGRPEERR